MDQFSLSLIFRFVYQECHNSLGHHIIHGFSDCAVVRDYQVLDHGGFHAGSRTALAGVVIVGTLEASHVWHMNRLDIFLHVLVDLVVVQVFYSFVLAEERHCFIFIRPNCHLSEVLDINPILLFFLFLLRNFHLFDLHSLVLSFVFLIVVWVKHAEYGIGAAHEVGVISVDV